MVKRDARDLERKRQSGKSEWELIPIFKFEPHPAVHLHGTSFPFSTGEEKDRLDATMLAKETCSSGSGTRMS